MARSALFRFKQFAIRQDRCAMKVCTDACVLGAWADTEQASHILDIGTGTGLLALMSAQRCPDAQIDGIELDEEAFKQATENVSDSPFADRIRIIQGALQEFAPTKRYDAIVVNPPFYQSDLRSPDRRINRAHHAQDLTFDELLAGIERLLADCGSWSVLLPLEESKDLYNKANKAGWMSVRALSLSHQPGKSVFRVLTTYVRLQAEQPPTARESLFIYEKDGKTYDAAFQALLKDFYLSF